jgi:hypothetical protein
MQELHIYCIMITIFLMFSFTAKIFNSTHLKKKLSTSNTILLANVISFCWDTSKHLNRQFFIIFIFLGNSFWCPWL